MTWLKEKSILSLISYYKWTVNLSIFIIGFAISIISAVDGLKFSVMLNWGITLLLSSIFINWLIIKRLITYSLIETEQVDSDLAKFFRNTLSNLKIYGLLQNLLFLIGLVLVVLSFIFGENSVGISISF